MKKAYILIRFRKKQIESVIMKGKPPTGRAALFKSEAAARKIQKRFKRHGVYLLSKV